MKTRWYGILIVPMLFVALGCEDPIVTKMVLVAGQAKVGQTFDLAVKIDPAERDVEDLYGMCYDIIYNTSDITFQGTVGINQDGTSPFVFAYETHNFRNGDPGRLVLCVSKEGQVAGNSGSGEIVRMRFNSVSSGGTTISFNDQYLVYSSGNNGPLKMPLYSFTVAP